MAPLILTILLVLMVAVCALIGFLRGFNKSIVRMITLVIAVILAFAVAIPITNILAENITVGGKDLDDLLVDWAMNVELLAEIVEYSPLFEKAVRVFPAFIIGILVLPVLFAAFGFVTFFLYNKVVAPLLKLLFKNHGEHISMGRKFAGLGIGAVSGLLIFGIVMTPLFGFLSVLPDRSALDETMDTLVEQEAISERAAEIVKGEFAVLDSGIVKAYSFLGASALGRVYLKSVSEIEYGDISTDLTAEADSLFTVIQTAVEGELAKVIIGKGDADDYYKVLSNTDFTSKLIKDMKASNLLRASVPAIMVMVVKSATGSIELPDDAAEKYDHMMDEIAILLAESDVNFEGIMSYQETYGVSYVDSSYSNMRTGMSEEAYSAELAKLETLTENIAEVIHRYVSGMDKETATHIAERFLYNISNAVREEGNDFVTNITSDIVKEIFSGLEM